MPACDTLLAGICRHYWQLTDTILLLSACICDDSLRTLVDTTMYLIELGNDSGSSSSSSSDLIRTATHSRPFYDWPPPFKVHRSKKRMRAEPGDR
jgi:hypothetical protein